jgi:hypothetical protein
MSATTFQADVTQAAGQLLEQTAVLTREAEVLEKRASSAERELAEAKQKVKDLEAQLADATIKSAAMIAVPMSEVETVVGRLIREGYIPSDNPDLIKAAKEQFASNPSFTLSYVDRLLDQQRTTEPQGSVVLRTPSSGNAAASVREFSRTRELGRRKA